MTTQNIPSPETENPNGMVISRAAVYMLCFAALVLVIYVCKIGKGVIIPFVVAFFLWYLINAVTRFFSLARVWKGKPFPRPVRLFAAIVSLTVLIGVVSYLVRGNIDDVVREAPKFQSSFEKILGDAAVRLGMDHQPTLSELVELAKKYVDIGQMIRSFAGMMTGLAGKTAVIVLFIALLLYEQRFFAQKIRRMVGTRAVTAQMHRILKVVDVKIQRYVGVKALVSALDSFLTFVILSFYAVDFAAFWGIMAFFLHFIPYAGSFVAISMPVIIALIQFGDLQTCLLVLATLCISHAFLGHILDPYLMGNNLNLSPIFIITNLAMWAMIWGVPGMFLAIPILAVFSIVLEQFKGTRPIAVLLSKTGELQKPGEIPKKV
ncbi:MAG: AI-2E family transporter [Bdellovibrionales bacterium]|jgi:predicted PurR-regulated permease PerM|nr:AI-2E family transporter [Bdellovibrionales bacterium]